MDRQAHPESKGIVAQALLKMWQSFIFHGCNNPQPQARTNSLGGWDGDFSHGCGTSIWNRLHQVGPLLQRRSRNPTGISFDTIGSHIDNQWWSSWLRFPRWFSTWLHMDSKIFKSCSCRSLAWFGSAYIKEWDKGIVSEHCSSSNRMSRT